MIIECGSQPGPVRSPNFRTVLYSDLPSWHESSHDIRAGWPVLAGPGTWVPAAAQGPAGPGPAALEAFNQRN
eukprot:747620-Hanusia_phi.AAC.2